MSGLFFAIVPDNKTRKDIVASVHQFNPDKSENIVDSKNVHMTLRYLGMVSDELLDTIKHDAGEINLPSFTFTIDKAEYWQKPGITVLTASETPDTLLNLVAELENICINVGLSSEKKPFKSHITVIKKSHNHLKETLENPVSWTVENFVLLISKTVKGVIVYTEIGQWSLVLNHK